MKLKDILAKLNFEKPDRDTVIEAWVGALLFVGVPFCSWLYFGGKVASVVFVGIQLVFWSVYLYRSNK